MAALYIVDRFAELSDVQTADLANGGWLAWDVALQRVVLRQPPAAGAIAAHEEAFTATAAQETEFALTYAPQVGTHIFLFRNGVKQPRNSFSTAGSTLTLNFATLAGDLLEVAYYHNS